MTTVSEDKLNETAEEYLVSHVTPPRNDDVTGHDDDDVTDHDDDVTAHNDDVTVHSDDVTHHGEGDNKEGMSGVHEDTFAEDTPKNEDIEVEKKVKWQGSEGT